MKSHQAGFTLLEMSIVLILISLLVGTVFTLIPIQMNTQQINTNITTLSTIQSAINTYVSQNNALPCPATTADALSSSTFGVSTDCTAAAPANTTDTVITGTYGIRYGAVPTRTLNLPDNYMFDGWNRRINYAVVKQMAIPTTQPINFNNFAQNFPGSTANTIQIIDASGNQINRSNSTTNPNYVAYILIAHGPAGDGATRYDGTTSIACPSASTTLDKENCNLDTVFMDSFYNDNASAYYDNKVAWKTYAQQAADSGINTSAASTAAVIGTYGLFTYNSTANLAAPSTLNTWMTRSINTVAFNTLANASLSSNQIVLGPGQYIIRALAHSYGVKQSKIRIYNVTTGTTLDIGAAAYSNTGVYAVSAYPEASAYFNATVYTTIRIDQMINSANTTNGWGISYSTDGTATDYLQVHVWQVG